MHKKLTMLYPAGWHGEMWREGAPFGSGLIGGMVYGGVWQENILFNHAFLWRGGKSAELPDVSDVLPEVRKALDAHDIRTADGLISDALYKKGYSGDLTVPTPLCDLLINTKTKAVFSDYRREVDMEKALVTVSWKEGGISYKREVFASRENNCVYFRYTSENGTIDADLSLVIHDKETLGDTVIPVLEESASGNTLFYAADNVSAYKPGNYGAVGKLFTNGKLADNGKKLFVSDATEIILQIAFFIEKPYKEAFAELNEALSTKPDFDEKLSAHTEIHNKLFSSVDFSLSSSDRTNEELLLDAFRNEASDELIEKLYAYGRYLFICSTDAKNTLPCHLTGLFNGTYPAIWAFYMYNVNFQMIYWQALTGNLPEFLRLALDYTEAFMPDFRENAKKIFGCRGILINSVNTPESGIYKCLAHHIVNWTGGAAWFSQHFWDYYQFTGDETYLREHALPFMYEAALFYEDFAVEAADGYYDLYPSVSPENTARNVMNVLGRDVETSKNAAMEFALMKELLTNLIKGAEITGMYPEKLDKWKEMLSKIRPYMLNEKGAVREWSDDYYEDNYAHRHHSHVYPVFPGSEVTKKDEIFKAFRKAEDLRLEIGIDSQSNWSIVYMAGIAARMERGNFAYEVLSALTKTCLMNNLLTVSNDWRRMGPVTCDDFRWVPFQIDGNIGLTGVINEMLVQSQSDDLFILPALPDKWKKGHVHGLSARTAIRVDINWNGKTGKAVLSSAKKVLKSIILGSGFRFEDGTTEKKITVGRKTILNFKR